MIRININDAYITYEFEYLVITHCMFDTFRFSLERRYGHLAVQYFVDVFISEIVRLLYFFTFF